MYSSFIFSSKFFTSYTVLHVCFYVRKLIVLKNIMNQTSLHKFIGVKYVLAWTKFETVANCDDQIQKQN